MKNILSLWAAIALTVAFLPLSGQTDKGFSYQAIARDVGGSLLTNAAIDIRFKILEGSNAGPTVYQEVHAITTNEYGLFSAVIGKGTPESGNFSTLDWGSDDYFLVVELDGNALDTSFLEAVPYAKVATNMTLDHLQDVAAASPDSGQVLKWNGTDWLPSPDEVEDGDIDSKNELQSLSISGSTLSISQGNSVALPAGTSYAAGTGIDITGATISNTVPDQTVNLTGSGATSISGTYPNFTISSTDDVNDADANPTNEIQSLSLSGNSLSISGGNSVSLPTGTTYTAGTGISISGSTITNTAPDQTVSLTGSGATAISGTYPNFTISSTDDVDDADANPTNEIQTLSLSGNTLSLSQSGGSINLAPFASPWSTASNNLYYTTGNVGIGDASPLATFTVGDGDKFQVHGNQGDVIFTDDLASIRFANASGATSPMMQMFTSGVQNGTRMLVAHSPSFPTWGIEYNDTTDAFTYMGDGIPVLNVQLGGQQRIGIGRTSPEAKLHVETNSVIGTGQLKLTETQLDFSRITMDNTENSYFWDIAARSDSANMVNTMLNFYHSEYGDVMSMNGAGTIGIGTYTPEAKMQIRSNSATGFGHLALTETQNDFSRLSFNNSIHPNFWEIAARTDTNLASSQVNFYHSDVGNIVAINARGRVGINDGSPGYPLEVNGNGSSRVIYAYNQAPITTGTTYNYGIRANLTQAINTGFPRLYNLYGSSTDNDAYLSYGVYAYVSGASNFNYGVYAYAPTSSGYAVYANGNMYCTGTYLPSDSRLKSGVVELGEGLNKVMALQPRTYYYDQEGHEFLNLPKQQQYGFVAQELREVMPELTQETFHAYDEATSDTEEGQGMWFTAVNYVGLIPILVAGMQEQQGIIEKQEQQILTQEQRIDDLEARLSAIEKLLEEK